MAQPTPPPLRRKTWRRVVLAVGVLALVLLVDVALMIPTALTAKTRMESGRDALQEGQAALASGDASAATEAFERARDSFAGARAASERLPLRLGALIPLVGRTPVALRELATSGTHLAEAGLRLAEGLDGLPGGINALAPEGGRIPIGRLQQLRPAVSAAVASLGEAAAGVDRIATAGVVGPVVEAIDVAKQRLSETLPVARAAESLLLQLPAFAGQERKQRYFVAGVNPAEMRGTGGFMGVWSILTIDDGRIHLAPFRDVAELPEGNPARLPLPADVSDYLYGGAEATTDWRSTNVMPDAPTAGSLISDLWSQAKGSRLDGVIFVDPQALALMLEATGPVPSSQLNTVLTADNVVAEVSNRVYERFDSAGTGARKEALGVAAGDVWRRFVGGVPPKAALDALARAASGGHLILYSTDPAIQAAFDAAGIAGAWREEGGDIFGAAINNLAANKVDYYLEQRLDYDITLSADGSAEATAMVSLTNHAPKGAQPSYVMGPYPDTDKRLSPGEDYVLLVTYCARACITTDARLDGQAMAHGQTREHGLWAQAKAFTIAPQQTREAVYRYALPTAWEGDTGSGTYRLRLLAQPTIRPTTAVATIHLPAGTHVIAASDNVTLGGDTVTYEGPVAREVEISLRFGEPWLQRTWGDFRDFLEEPVRVG